MAHNDEGRGIPAAALVVSGIARAGISARPAPGGWQNPRNVLR